MNTPNKLTILRIIMVPFFVAFLLITAIPQNYLWALVVFILASITDALDGHIARKYNLITNFGKFLDPLADKVLVVSALVCFSAVGLIDPVVVVVIISREFLVTSLRLVASDGGKVIAASIWGKLKTVMQMVAIIAILAMETVKPYLNSSAFDNGFFIAGEVLVWIAGALTIISGVEYLISNKEFINHTK